MSSPVLIRYMTEFDSSLAPHVESALSAALSDPSSPSADACIEEAEGFIAQAEDLVRSMGIESRGAGSEAAADVKRFKSRCGDWRAELSDAKAQVDRASLLGGPGGGSNGGGQGGSDEHRARLLASSDIVDAQNSRLSGARQVLADTEITALEITEELGRNRERIRSAHGRVHEVSGLTNAARQVVQNMRRREVQQKVAVYAVALLLAGGVMFLIFHKFRGKDGVDGGASGDDNSGGNR
mmetsp:Transcript_20448/g.40899  ORF Transcript_20448/g.40899 Transcript_20448/m.40899 type:complete len:239 (+) Transcript_20448:141-857(+)